MIQRSQVKSDNTSENLQNEIRQIIYSFYWKKEITKKVIIKSITMCVVKTWSNSKV